MASALALSERKADARTQIAELLRFQLEITLSHLKRVEPPDAPAVRAQREKMYEGLRLAGLPQ